jgi:hypothetical protein
MMESLFLHERGKIYNAIANAKRAIMLVEKMIPQTQQTENALEALRAKELELLQQAKDHKYIESLVAARLRKIYTRAANHSKSQSETASKPRSTRGMTPEERKRRNEKIRAEFGDWKKSDNAFDIKYGKKLNLSPSTIRKIRET